MTIGSSESLNVSPGNTMRPIGVWLLTVWDALFVGLAPLLLVGLIMINEEAQSEISLSPLRLLGSVFLASSILSGAVLAWRGNRTGRNVLVVAVIIHHCQIAFNNVSLALFGAPVEVETTRL